MNTTDTIEEVLKEDPKAREKGSFNTWLYLIKVMRRLGVNMYIKYDDLRNAPSPESILKIRRDILHKKNKYNDEEVYYEEGITYEPKKLSE